MFNSHICDKVAEGRLRVELFICCCSGFKFSSCSKTYCCGFWYSASKLVLLKPDHFRDAFKRSVLQTVVSTAQPSGCIKGMKLAWALAGCRCSSWVFWAKIISKLKENVWILAKTHLHALFLNHPQLQSFYAVSLHLSHPSTALHVDCFTCLEEKIMYIWSRICIFFTPVWRNVTFLPLPRWCH